MNLTRRERIMIITGLVVISLVAYIFYFLIPYINSSNDAKAKYNDAQTQLGILNAKANNIKQLDDEIEALESALKDKGATIPQGMDHARILLYLKDLTTGRAENVSIRISGEPAVSDGFMIQPVTVEFQTSYPVFKKIMGELKKNRLYNRVTFLKVDYVPGNPTVAPVHTPGDEPEPTPAPAADSNVIFVHMELSFFSFQPEGGVLPEPPLAPASKDRAKSLFPLE